MTLLIAVAGPSYALSCSDMRITVQSGKRYIPVDEKFNKHIVFHADGFNADVSYTGTARWNDGKRDVKLYDIISKSIAMAAKSSKALAPLCLQVALDLLDVFAEARKKGRLKRPYVELQIIGYHRSIPWPMIAVISTFRADPPWSGTTQMEWQYHFGDVHFYFKAAEGPEVIFGGADSLVRDSEKESLRTAVARGADAFDVSRMAAALIERVAGRTQTVGKRSVAVVIPQEGFVDTNLWDKAGTELVGYMPRIIGSDGTMMGPSEMPVSLTLFLDGYLPRNSLFFRSVVAQQFKRGDRRKIFRRTKGEAIPGLMGLIGLALYGKIQEGYSDFGLGAERIPNNSLQPTRPKRAGG